MPARIAVAALQLSRGRCYARHVYSLPVRHNFHGAYEYATGPGVPCCSMVKARTVQ